MELLSSGGYGWTMTPVVNSSDDTACWLDWTIAACLNSRNHLVKELSLFYYGTDRGHIVTSLTKYYHQQHYLRNYSVTRTLDGDSLNLIRLILTARAIDTTDSTCLCKFDQFGKNDSLFRQFSSGDDLARDNKGYWNDSWSQMYWW